MADTQVLVGTTATIEARFYADGALANDNPVTIGITKADGSVLVAAGTATTNSATGVYRFNLAAQAELNLLTATWTGATQTIRTKVEIVGAYLFILTELRALKVAGGTPFSDISAYPDAKLLEARTQTLDEFEQILAFAPVPRFARATLDGDGSTCLELPGLLSSRVLSVTVNGVAQTVGNYQVGRGNMLEAVASYGIGTAFTVGRRNVVVEWVHGWERVVGKAGNIAMLHAASVLLPGMSSSASTVVTPDGTSYSYDPAGQVTAAGTVRHTGIPVIDAWLNRHAQPGAMAAR